jgi:hypothetical protein
MIRKTIGITFAILLFVSLAGLAHAQYGRGRMGHGFGMGRGGGYCMRAAAGQCAFDFNPGMKTTLDGSIEEIYAVPGSGSPGFQLRLSDNSIIRVLASPFWASAGFNMAVGDQVQVVAFPPVAGTAQPNIYLAQSIKNQNKNAYIQLRDDNGIPLNPNLARRGLQ